ncbi:Dolichol kinase [Halogranum gelatinilyticum]|uniref:Dolichol kinase n=1 Tax=Halogranum gelatinilyticum TaxID=660521 RepID=A0A1G9NZI9_9EURY|nr:dolichol kinase [Halogranum gelatinilyticum]SDL91978.1 Dolichol kinase [Halogranum gelatinilyticum]
MSEIGRRLVHVSGTALPGLYLLDLVSWTQLGYLLVFGSLVVAVLEVLRLQVGLDWWIYRELTREYEQDNPAGYALYFFSMTAVALVFAPYVAIPGMLMLTIGDPISGILGSNDAGTAKQAGVLLAMFGVCFALAWPFVDGATSSFPIAVAAAGLGALGATLADGLKPVVAGYVVDDNLSIPPAAAVGIWLVLTLGA